MLLPTSCGPGRPLKKSTSLKSTKPKLNSLNQLSNNFNDQNSENMKNYRNDKLMMLNGKQQQTKFQKRTNNIFNNLKNLKNSLNWILIIFTFFIVLTWNGDGGGGVNAEKSKHYYMQSLCKNHFLQQLYRKIDGAVLWSQNERNLDCVITFQTHSILQRFMLRFDLLQLDCNDHLYIYDGAHAVGAHKADLSCRNTKQSVGSIFTRTNFVTLKYVTDGWGTDANGFKLVITAVKDSKHTCKDFRCTLREFCIHPDLVCDNVNHCGDNSDESTSNLCQKEDDETLNTENMENNVENKNIMTDKETSIWNFLFKIFISLPKILYEIIN